MEIIQQFPLVSAKYFLKHRVTEFSIEETISDP